MCVLFACSCVFMGECCLMCGPWHGSSLVRFLVHAPMLCRCAVLCDVVCDAVRVPDLRRRGGVLSCVLLLHQIVGCAGGA